MSRKASCSCGRLSAEVEGPPVRVSICHCLACQRRTGSVFGAQARFHPEAVKIHGEGSRYVRIGDSGKAITFTFCPHCGATVHYQIEGDARIGIPIGAFADPSFPGPAFSVYEESMHSWVRVPEDIEHSQ